MKFRTYKGDRTESGDYRKIHDFLVESENEEYTYARFDWMMTNWEYLEDQYLNRIGIWEDDEQNGKIVGATLYDHELDIIFPIALSGYESLYPQMIDYAKANMVRKENPNFHVFASDSNMDLIHLLKKSGFVAMEQKDMVARYEADYGIPEYALPDGYRITSLAEEEDFRKYLLCMFKGFGHEESNEEFVFNQEKQKEMERAYNKRKCLDKSLKLSVVNENGDYVAHCGMWYDAASQIAVIEPVCVIPEYRKKGLGRAVVFEGIRRVLERGAKRIVVGSSQQFYYSIGMVPYKTGTLWKLK